MMQTATASFLRQHSLYACYHRTNFKSTFFITPLFSSIQTPPCSDSVGTIDRFRQQQSIRYKGNNASKGNVRRWGTKKKPSVPHKHPQISSSSSGTNSGKKLNNPSSKAWLLRQSKDEYARRARKEGSPSRAIYKLEQIDELYRRKQKNSKKVDSKGAKKQLFQKGDVVVDLGAAPGGWSMYASSQVKSDGMVIAVDLLPLDDRALHQNERQSTAASSIIHAIQGDFRSSQIKGDIFDVIIMHHEPIISTSSDFPFVDVVMSDMAANFTGDKITDALKTMSLCEEALAFAVGMSAFYDSPSPKPTSGGDLGQHGVLRPGGIFLCKFFSCGRENERDLMDGVKRCFARTEVLKPPASRKESAEQYLLATGYKGPS